MPEVDPAPPCWFSAARLELEPLRENEVNGRKGFGMCKLPKNPLDEVEDRPRCGGVSAAGVRGNGTFVGLTKDEAVDDPRRSGLAGLDGGLEPGLDPGRLPGLEEGFDPGGEYVSRVSVLINSESIQLR